MNYWQGQTTIDKSKFCLSFYKASKEEIRELSNYKGNIASMDSLIGHLEMSNHPNKWQKFVDALEDCGWSDWSLMYKFMFSYYFLLYKISLKSFSIDRVLT